MVITWHGHHHPLPTLAAPASRCYLLLLLSHRYDVPELLATISIIFLQKLMLCAKHESVLRITVFYSYWQMATLLGLKCDCIGHIVCHRIVHMGGGRQAVRIV